MSPEAHRAETRRAYARQAVVAFDLYKLIDGSGLPNCQAMMAMHLALELSAKAHQPNFALKPTGENAGFMGGHQLITATLPMVYRRERERRDSAHGQPPNGHALEAIMKPVRYFCAEVDHLYPNERAPERPDNCKYPWALADKDGQVMRILSPLDQSFLPHQLYSEHREVRRFFAVMRDLVNALAKS